MENKGSSKGRIRGGSKGKKRKESIFKNNICEYDEISEDSGIEYDEIKENLSIDI